MAKRRRRPLLVIRKYRINFWIFSVFLRCCTDPGKGVAAEAVTTANAIFFAIKPLELLDGHGKKLALDLERRG